MAIKKKGKKRKAGRRYGSNARSIAAKKGWKRRKARERVEKRLAELESKKESVNAGWTTRRANQEAKLLERQIKASQYLAKGDVILFDRSLLLTPGVAATTDGTTLEGKQILADMIRYEDPRWTVFLATCLRKGLSPVEARNAWFSPKARNWKAIAA